MLQYNNLICTAFIIKEYFIADLIIFLLISSAEQACKILCILLEFCVY
jgi:hypothetical protein